MAPSLPIVIIMKSKSCVMSVLSIISVPIPSLWYATVLGCLFLSMFSLGSVNCQPARDTVVKVELISCHHGSCIRTTSKGLSLQDVRLCIAACMAAFEWLMFRLHTLIAVFHWGC